jgi:hypothetical protein
MLARNVGTNIAYCRYDVDGYGEQIDRANWTGADVGRVWPLLAGGRGQYAVLAHDGRAERPQGVDRSAMPTDASTPRQGAATPRTRSIPRRHGIAGSPPDVWHRPVFSAWGASAVGRSSTTAGLEPSMVNDGAPAPVFRRASAPGVEEGLGHRLSNPSSMPTPSPWRLPLRCSSRSSHMNTSLAFSTAVHGSG